MYSVICNINNMNEIFKEMIYKKIYYIGKINIYE